MRSNTLSSALCVVLASSVQALPNLAERAVACNRDNCLRDIIEPKLSSLGYAECSSFLLKTVTPCVVTSTETASETTTVLTVTDVVEEFTTTVLWETEFTTTTTTSTLGALTVRAVEARETGLAQPAAVIDARTVTDCPATASPTAIPTYASRCSGAVRYSSACSCIGVTGSVTTLPAVTTTVTTTETSSATDYTTSTNTNVVTEVSTTTSVVVEVTTVPAPCTTFLARKVGGGPANNGRWIRGASSFAHSLEAKGASEKNQATNFVLNADGTIKFPANGNLWSVINTTPNLRRQMRLYSATQAGVTKVTCTIGTGPAASGNIVCSTPTQSLVWVACNGQTVDHLWAVAADQVASGCEIISLVAQENCPV